MLPQFISQKFRFWSFVSMVLLVFVHGYNLEVRYLQIVSMPAEALDATTFTEYFLANGILRFRIPMLFIISGYLFAMMDSTPHRDRIRKRVRTLLLPYLLWSALCLALFYVAELFQPTPDWIAAAHVAQIDETRMLVHDYHWWEWLIRLTLAPLPYQLWFIRVLFIYNLAYPWIRNWVLGPRSVKVFFGVVTFLWLGNVQLFLFEGEGLLCFALGVWMQKTGFNISQPSRWLRPGWWAVAFVSAATIKTYLAFGGHTLLGNGIYPVLILLHKLTVASGLIAAWFGCDAFVRRAMARAWFVWLTGFSFIIYAVHAPWVAVLIDPAFALLGDVPGKQMLVFILLPLALIAFSVALGAVMRKVAPGVYGVLTGGRGLG